MLLKDKLAGRRLILASQSPRRRELIAGYGIDFTIADNYDVEEVFPDDLTATEVPQYLADLKSKAYPHELSPEDILITADTVVLLGERIIGKPKSHEEAVQMLRDMSGTRHTVVTGVTIRSASNLDSFSVKTDVWFRRMRDEEIEFYVDNYNPYDKAGGYGIQEWIGYVGIGRIEGSFYNVMGLPIQALYTALEKFVSE